MATASAPSIAPPAPTSGATARRPMSVANTPAEITATVRRARRSLNMTNGISGIR